jgi:inosine/xanthosine triphosphatase
MIKILVGSKNPVKIEATRDAFSKYFPDVRVDGFDVKSRVSAQPFAEETFAGAENRALELQTIDQEQGLGSDFFVGIEGGVTRLYSKSFALGVSCVIDLQERSAYGVSPCFELPESISRQIDSGKELGQIMEELSGHENIRQKEGAIGFFTHGVMDRKTLYIQSLVVALVPLLNKDLYYPT